MATSPFTVIQGPCSYSFRLWLLVLLCKDLEPLIIASYTFAISDCILYILACVLDSFAGSIVLYMVDIQRSSGVAVAGVRI